jgi:hypothetical protein
MSGIPDIGLNLPSIRRPFHSASNLKKNIRILSRALTVSLIILRALVVVAGERALLNCHEHAQHFKKYWGGLYARIMYT